jgi:hypothetical protein
MAQTASIDQRRRDLHRFYQLLQQLEAGVGGKRRLGACTGQMAWPPRGVYFFFEAGETRSCDPKTSRVVRVGTHAVSQDSKSTLWGRLRQHRGGLNLGGNHRGSIFRMHAGAALIARQDLQCRYPHWNQRKPANEAIRTAEVPMERTVSDYLGSMSLLWLNVDDAPTKDSARGVIERNSIALLSGRRMPLDGPSAEWLGRASIEPLIRASGLWNLNYVNDDYDREFLRVLEQCVEHTVATNGLI